MSYYIVWLKMAHNSYLKTIKNVDRLFEIFRFIADTPLQHYESQC